MIDEDGISQQADMIFSLGGGDAIPEYLHNSIYNG